ncbi:anthranilate synthase component 1 [Aliiglaciecola sp. CAU 1673]|uniref:anthranilate synthase component 1 n=1 Tax=Aliiglaciecola sp. CAU 1673 TaxID=3032595 RepID=UPI0023DC20FD|nr:anthranilate synthase component 1 [Aliiglaciecola sp. CAU 1673]MDF2178777.1 anthranilate synthase component 1 [Aliiglaciecola sp. CAU 1673]
MSLAKLSESTGKVETLIRPAAYQADPLRLYRQLCQDKANSLLLESAEIDSKDNLKSLILIDAALRLECNGHVVKVQALSANGQVLLPLLAEHCPAKDVSHLNQRELLLHFHTPSQEQDEDSRLKTQSVFDSLRTLLQHITPLRDHPDALFLGGVFAYDLLAGFEDLPAVSEGDNDCPDFVFYLAETLLLIDHQARQTQLIGSVFSGPSVATNYFTISQRLEALEQIMQAPISLPLNKTPSVSADDLTVSKSDDQYCEDVRFLKEHILAGDIFQVVPSRTFSLPCPDPHLAYAKLKEQNPSPYMFYMHDEAFCIFGASPESALKYSAHSNEVEVYPIAGTRPRGVNVDGSLNRDLDSRIELDLREDSKEKAEHLMLVDLARNDIARVSKPGTRYVKDLLKVDRYSQVMHLVSRVVGELREDLDPLHAYQACMNMGTLVGAPKVSAACLIRQVEKTRRGSYGGAVGYLNSQGDMDTCIVIRSAFVKGGTAYVQAGAGVVYDSSPQSEANETRSKAKAVLRAIMDAHHEARL